MSSVPKCTYKNVKSILLVIWWAVIVKVNYKGLFCFMIVGLKNYSTYVIKSSPETKINADWLKEKLKDCLAIFSKSGWNELFIRYKLRKISMLWCCPPYEEHSKYFFSLHSSLMVSKIPSTFQVEKQNLNLFMMLTRKILF